MKHINALFLILIITPNLWAAGKTLSFPEQKMERNYVWLINNLRCQKCVNQTLSDSQSDLAGDLRHRVYKLVLSGKSRDQVVDYLVQRFGDRVSYNPPFKLSTALLWLSPFILLVLGLIVMMRTIHKRDAVATANTRPLSDTQQQRLDQLLGNESADETKSNHSVNAQSIQEKQS